MSSQIAFRVFVANTDVTDVDEVLDFVESQSSDVSTFRRPPRPGLQMSAGDYLLVLNTAGSIASIAGIIWMAYDKFIASKKAPESNAGIILHLEPAHRDVQLNFWVGGQQKTKEEFTDDFTKQVSAVAENIDSDYLQAVDTLMSRPTSWVPRSEYTAPPASELRIDDAELEQLSRMFDEMDKSSNLEEGK